MDLIAPEEPGVYESSWSLEGSSKRGDFRIHFTVAPPKDSNGTKKSVLILSQSQSSITHNRNIKKQKLTNSATKSSVSGENLILLRESPSNQLVERSKSGPLTHSTIETREIMELSNLDDMDSDRKEKENENDDTAGDDYLEDSVLSGEESEKGKNEEEMSKESKRQKKLNARASSAKVRRSRVKKRVDKKKLSDFSSDDDKRKRKRRSKGEKSEELNRSTGSNRSSNNRSTPAFKRGCKSMGDSLLDLDPVLPKKQESFSTEEVISFELDELQKSFSDPETLKENGDISTKTKVSVIDSVDYEEQDLEIVDLHDDEVSECIKTDSVLSSKAISFSPKLDRVKSNSLLSRWQETMISKASRDINMLQSERDRRLKEISFSMVDVRRNRPKSPSTNTMSLQSPSREVLAPAKNICEFTSSKLKTASLQQSKNN